ncbi:MAG: hypothetical protein AAFV25_20985, partial [Bacteroidota bacterium]
MKRQIVWGIFCLQIACAGQVETSPPTQTAVEEIDVQQDSLPKPSLANWNRLPSGISYETVKAQLEKERRQLAPQDLPADSIQQLFKTALLNKIIPFWEGTKWSFEGHTSKPKSGHIACGYFVSTTLRDAGLRLNRYRLAQQSPLNEAKSLAIGTEVNVFSSDSTAQNILAIQAHLEEGI